MRLPVYGLSSLDSRVIRIGNREEVIQTNMKREGKQEKEGGERGIREWGQRGKTNKEKHNERGGNRENCFF